METNEEDCLDGSGAGRETEERTIALLLRRGVAFRVHAHPVAASVLEATEQLPFPADRFLKTLAFRATGGGWILAALRGEIGLTTGNSRRRSGYGERIFGKRPKRS